MKLCHRITYREFGDAQREHRTPLWSWLSDCLGAGHIEERLNRATRVLEHLLCHHIITNSPDMEELAALLDFESGHSVAYDMIEIPDSGGDAQAAAEAAERNGE